MTNKKHNLKSVQTELGEATVGVVRLENASKIYSCPICEAKTEVGEEHYLVVPLVKPRLRRHIHFDCLEAFIENGFSIKLHPNEPDIAKYYF